MHGRTGAVLLAVGALLLSAAPAAASNLQLNIGATVSAPASTCSIFSFSSTGAPIASAEDCTGQAGMEIYGDVPAVNQASGSWSVIAPAGIVINQVWVPSGDMFYSDPGNQWAAGMHWANGGDVHWNPGAMATNTIDIVSDINSQWWQFWLACQQTSCSDSAVVHISGLHIFATETAAPAVAAIGSNNIWYQTSNWIWNPAGDPWPAGLSATDPTGICSAEITTNDVSQYYGPLQPNQNNDWQQCPQLNWTSPTVDTQQYFPGSSGQLPYQVSATNAAGNTSSPAEILNVDNVPPTVTLTTPNDPNPGGWAVNHAVVVHVTPQAGPSGISSLTCTVDGAPVQLDSNDDLTVDGNGRHTVGCSVANNAVGPQGQHDVGTGSLGIDIDEQPPTLGIEPQNPSDPAQLTVDTSDSESPVAGGSVQIAPAGTANWTQVPAALTSDGHLLATIPDAGRHGPYTVQATACSQVGNCGSTSETLTLPLRAPSVSDVSLAKIANPLVAKKVKKRVRVGWHWAAVLRHGKAVKVKRGGHWKTITVIKLVERCKQKRVKTGKHRWRVTKVCKAPRIKLRRSARIGHGKPVTVHGLLESGQHIPLADTRVQIIAAADNGSRRFRQVATATTNSRGVWSAKLPAGPSRIIRAVFPGSQTLLPAAGTASVTVPAKIELSARPKVLPWSGVVTFRGRLVGGYVPPDGVALRLLVRYPGSRRPSSLLALRTNRRGQFKIRWSYDAGRGVATYAFSVATTANESDYPFAAGASRRIRITFGR